jgi:hypothetical protein
MAGGLYGWSRSAHSYWGLSVGPKNDNHRSLKVLKGESLAGTTTER